MPSSFICQSYGGATAGRALGLGAPLVGANIGVLVAAVSALVALLRRLPAGVPDGRAAGLQGNRLRWSAVVGERSEPRLAVEDVALRAEAAATGRLVDEIVAGGQEGPTAVRLAATGAGRVAVDDRIGDD